MLCIILFADKSWLLSVDCCDTRFAKVWVEKVGSLLLFAVICMLSADSWENSGFCCSWGSLFSIVWHITLAYSVVKRETTEVVAMLMSIAKMSVKICVCCLVFIRSAKLLKNAQCTMHNAQLFLLSKNNYFFSVEFINFLYFCVLIIIDFLTPSARWARPLRQGDNIRLIVFWCTMLM